MKSARVGFTGLRLISLLFHSISVFLIIEKIIQMEKNI